MNLALVLGGGGARGSYQIGVWKAMNELDIKADIVTGTSVGAINGAIITQDEYEKALDLWLNIENKMIFGGIYEEIAGKSKFEIFIEKLMKNDLVNMNPLKELLNKTLDEEKIRKSQTEFGIMTVDKDAYKHEQVFIEDIAEGKLVDYIMASAALYPFVKPHDIDGKKYIDGGFYDNLPINMAISNGADEIIAVDLRAIGIIRENGESCEKKVIRISPYRDLGSIIDFKSSQMKKNIDLGYMDAMKAFKVFGGMRFTFLEGEIEKLERMCYDRFAKIYSVMDDDFKRELIPDGRCIEELMKFIDSFVNGKKEDRSLILQGGEGAGDMFGVDYIKIYTAQSFKDAIRYGVMEVENDEAFSMDDLNDVDIIGVVKNILIPKSRVVIIAKIIKNIEETKSPKEILKVLSINKDEFKIALFLYGASCV